MPVTTAIRLCPISEAEFRLTALADRAEEYEAQLRSLLRLTPLRTVQWVNVARHRVQLVSVCRGKQKH